ncbi:hypothetical protein KM043_003966 [Ampulex compressa]|nr:hypothetical protein KM043_003966 [Ampulex compressa]
MRGDVKRKRWKRRIWCKNVMPREAGGAGGGKRPEGLETSADRPVAKEDAAYEPRMQFLSIRARLSRSNRGNSAINRARVSFNGTTIENFADRPTSQAGLSRRPGVKIRDTSSKGRMGIPHKRGPFPLRTSNAPDVGLFEVESRKERHEGEVSANKGNERKAAEFQRGRIHAVRLIITWP